MTNIEEFAIGEALFDGHYRLLRPMSKADGTTDVWLALDVNTIDNYFLQFEDNNHVIDESTGLQVAIKVIRQEKAFNIEDEQRFRDGYKIVHECHHDNLLQPINFSVFMGIPYLVLPYCESGSVEKFIGEKMSNTKLWKLISDVASGLDALHTNNLVHQNVKPANILIDDGGNFVLTDFAIGSQKMSNDKISPENDIWAFGVTLCEILTGGVPFGEKGGKAQACGNMSLPNLKGISSSIRNLIKACLEKDPKKRPTAHQIMEAAQKKRFPIEHKKLVWPIVVAIFSILIVGGVIGYFNSQKPLVQSVPEEKYTYDSAVVLLKDKASAIEGLRILDTLVARNDYQATFLMSRLYFDNSDYRDTMFFEPIWAVMRSYCGIQPDNKKAHNLLMQAFRLNESDCVLLYQLGNDFMARGRRGCDRDDSRSLWCFNQVEKLLEHMESPVVNRYHEAATEKKQRILETPNIIIPQKP